MGNPTDRAENPIMPEEKICSKCKQGLLAYNEQGGEICMNMTCENYNAEFIRKSFPTLKEGEVYLVLFW